MRARLYKYTHAQTVFTLSIVNNKAERARSIVIIKHKHMCNYKIVINICYVYDESYVYDETV